MPNSTNDKLSIKLNLYGTSLTIHDIAPAEEPLYRDAAILINETVGSLAEIYSKERGMANVLYMALVDIAVEYMRASKQNDTKPFRDILGKLTSEIEEVIKEPKTE